MVRHLDCLQGVWLHLGLHLHLGLQRLQRRDLNTGRIVCLVQPTDRSATTAAESSTHHRGWTGGFSCPLISLVTCCHRQSVTFTGPAQLATCSSAAGSSPGLHLASGRVGGDVLNFLAAMDHQFILELFARHVNHVIRILRECHWQPLVSQAANAAQSAAVSTNCSPAVSTWD